MNDTRLPKTTLTAALTLLTAALLSACGGANDSSADDTPAATASQDGSDRATAQSLVPSRPEDSSAIFNVDVPGGAGVYVDAAVGNDSNPGTQALPWKTLGKLVAARLPAGQGIYLHCGATWRESVMLDGRQFADGAVISGYGPCTTSKAVITGADDFSSGWVKYGSVWQRAVPLQTPKITRLFVNGAPQRTAQWPNYLGVGKEYAYAKADMARSSTVLAVATANLPAVGAQDMIGATVIVRSEPWILEQRTVTASDGAGKLTLNAPTTYGMEGGDGYVLQDKFWMLNSAGEFFHDTARGLLFLWPKDSGAQTNLNAYKVEGAVRDGALHLRNRSNLTIRHIAFTRTKQDGLVLADTPNAVVENVAADDSGNDGIRLVSSSATVPSPAGSVIRNSSFTRNASTAIDAGVISNVTISGNVITDTGMSPHAGNSNAAINVGPSGLAEKNTIRRSALAGIHFSGTGGTRVLGNLVEDSCQRLSDGGGIKTWNGNKNAVNQSSLVEGNVVVRAPGNTEGAVGGAMDMGVGIYLDEYTQGATLRNNFIAAAEMGIVVHNSSHLTVENNRVALVNKAPLFATMDRTDADYMTGNVFRNNQWVTPGTSTGTFPSLPQPIAPQAIWFWHSLLGAGALGASTNSFVNNEFVLPNGTSVPAVMVRSNAAQSMLTVQDWLRSNPTDLVNSATPQYATSRLTMGANLIAQGGFDTGLGAWTNYAAAATPRGTVTAGSQTGCDAMCAIMKAGTLYDSLMSPAFSMNAGGLYYLSYTTSFVNDGSVSRPGVRRVAAPYDGFAASRISSSALKGIAGSTLNQETFFTSTSSEPATLTLSAVAGTQVAFDRVSLRQVLGYTLSTPAEWVSYAYADPLQAKTVTCASLGWPTSCSVTDLSGRAVALPTSLPAGSAAVFLRADSAWRTN